MSNFEITTGDNSDLNVDRSASHLSKKLTKLLEARLDTDKVFSDTFY